MPFEPNVVSSAEVVAYSKQCIDLCRARDEDVLQYLFIAEYRNDCVYAEKSIAGFL